MRRIADVEREYGRMGIVSERTLSRDERNWPEYEPEFAEIPSLTSLGKTATT
jgi:hypothetical protein